MRTSNYYTTRKKPEEEKRGLIWEQISNSQLLERALSARQHLHTEAGQFVHESIIFSAQNNQTYQITRKRNAPLLLIKNSQGGLNNICSAAGIRQCQPKAAARTARLLRTVMSSPEAPDKHRSHSDRTAPKLILNGEIW